ncbi:MAG: NAD(P)/FAD-dependent oxidoreductase [Candidimonas sp.]|nr:MAG: NAD(P)/FAD-dependent oxidoreductase [Candidimonas sp.]
MKATPAGALPHIVIVGGGFGGLWAARALALAPLRITLIDRSNHHVFQPLLYQVAGAGLSGTDIAAPLRYILRRQRNVTVWMDEVTGIDLDARRVRTRRRSLAYDGLIVATGSTDTYFGHEHWAANAPALKTLDDALVIRRRILSAFEAAEREADPARRRQWLTFVIVGGGPTGVELAGTLLEIARHTLPREFRHAHPGDAIIHIVEAGPRLLPAMPARLAAIARRRLERLGARVHLDTAVTDVHAMGVRMAAGAIEARTVLWAAGTAASRLGRALGCELDRAGRARVEPDLSLPGHPDVFVIGDLACVTQDGTRVPGVAPAAKQMGRYAARALRGRLAGATPRPFRYRDYGTLASISRGFALVHLRGLQLHGFPGWLFWLFAHLFFLIGFRNRLAVMWNWAWSYATWQRTARVIVGHDPAAPETPISDQG